MIRVLVSLVLLLTATHSRADDIECASSFNPTLTENGQIDYSSITSCLAQIERLNLINQPIKQMPADIFAKMPALNSVLIKNCGVTSLNDNFFTENMGAKLISLSFIDNPLVDVDEKTFSKFQTLVALSLAGSKITKLPPDVFKGMTKLQTLKLHDNEIRELEPQTFNSLISLQHLDLHENQLTTFSADLLKAAKKPVKVSLQKNQITSFTATSPNNQVYYLDLQYNKMTMIPADFAKLTGLTQLLMSHNPLELNHNSLRNLPKSVTQLFISNVGLSKLPNPLTIFSGLENLYALSIGYNQLTTLTNMPYLPKLNTLMVYDNLLPDSIDFSTIKTSLPRLKEIGLSRSEPLWSCTQVARMLSQLEEFNIGHFFYKSSSKVFGVGNNVENIGCTNNESDQRNENLSTRVAQLEAQLKDMEGKLVAQTELVSSQATKLEEMERNLVLGKELVSGQMTQLQGQLQAVSDKFATKNEASSSQLGTMQNDLKNLKQDFENFSICESFERCRGKLL